MDLISYLLFVFTLIIFLRTRKNQVNKTMKTRSEKLSQCQKHPRVKTLSTLEAKQKTVMTKIGMYFRKQPWKKIRTYSEPSKKRPNERKATHTQSK